MNEKTKTVCFKNGRILRDHALVKESLWISDGKIVAPQKNSDVEIDAEGLIIAPGFIDLQINGAFGVDFSQNPEQLPLVAEQLPKFGVTAFLSTLTSIYPADYHAVIPQLRELKGNGATHLGIHLEGPFLNSGFTGAHNQKALLSTLDNFEECYGSLANVRLVTLAPELPQALPAIQRLRSLSICVAAGHSNATYSEMLNAIQAGLQLVTHFGNAMRSLHQREPGIIGAVLTHPELYYSVIADGIHLAPTFLKIAYQCNPRGLILVSDAMSGFGMVSGQFKLGSSMTAVQNGRAYLKDTEKLAGSILSMDEAVRNLHKWTGCSLVDALEAASLRPAKLLGIEKHKGHLQIGADADFVLLNDHLKVQSCYIAGLNCNLQMNKHA